MAKLAWAVICQRALLDQENNVSLIQILEELGVPAAPPDKPAAVGSLIPFKLAVVTSWRRDADDKRENTSGRLRFLSPSGKKIAETKFEVDLESFSRVRCLAELPGVPFHGPGLYVIRVEVATGNAWRRVGEIDFTLHHNIPETPGGVAAH